MDPQKAVNSDTSSIEEKKKKRQPARARIAAASGVPPAILRFDGVMSRTGLARSTIYLKLHQDPTFPKPVRVGGVQGWVASEIDEWIADQIRASRSPVAA